MELQQARDRLNAAKSELAERGKEAERAAAQAHLFAELAVGKSQSADARKSANEVLASLEMLRRSLSAAHRRSVERISECIVEVKVMKLSNRVVLSVAIAAILSACSTPPPHNESLETARTVVPESKSSRAGVAAVDISNARKSLDAANRIAEAKGERADIEYEANNAVTSAQIANEKILTAQANEEIANGTAQRQAVLLQARERESQHSADQVSDARRQADASAQRADSLEAELADLKVQKTERGLVLTSATCCSIRARRP